MLVLDVISFLSITVTILARTLLNYFLVKGHRLRKSVWFHSQRSKPMWFSPWNKFTKSPENSTTSVNDFIRPWKSVFELSMTSNVAGPQTLWMHREFHGAHPQSTSGNDESCPTSNRPFESLPHHSKMKSKVWTYSYPRLHLLGSNVSWDYRWYLTQHRWQPF